jgi:hypothetical protein
MWASLEITFYLDKYTSPQVKRKAMYAQWLHNALTLLWYYISHMVETMLPLPVVVVVVVVVVNNNNNNVLVHYHYDLIDIDLILILGLGHLFILIPPFSFRVVQYVSRRLMIMTSPHSIT